MTDDRHKLLVESIRRLSRRGATTHLSNIINKAHAADLSAAFRFLSQAQQRRLIGMIGDVEKKGHLLSEIDTDTFLMLVADMTVEELVRVFEHMPADDAADLIARLPEERSTEILKRMKREGSVEVADLLRYADDTAGGIMVTDYIALTEDTTARQAIASLQKEYSDVEMPFYLYVVDAYGNLVGVISLRQLVVVPPDTPLREFMTTDVVAVQTHVDQEEVARIVARYDILAVPVVNESNKLVGIVTVDDVIDIFRAEATEDILKMAGAGEEFVETKSVLRSTRIRLPWLLASCMGGLVAFYVINHFETSLARMTYLAAFIPVIMGMGGNIGTQSSTIVVRGLATGRINLREIWPVVAKELAVGCGLGAIYGFLIGTVAQVQYTSLAFSVSVSLGVFSSMAVAALVGSFVPMTFARINIDPAVATGPIVTTAVDIISVFCYFQIATSLLGL